jgi:hypothetical protein
MKHVRFMQQASLSQDTLVNIKNVRLQDIPHLMIAASPRKTHIIYMKHFIRTKELLILLKKIGQTLLVDHIIINRKNKIKKLKS